MTTRTFDNNLRSIGMDIKVEELEVDTFNQEKREKDVSHIEM